MQEQSMKQTSFYLHTKKNRLRYPSIKYPLTHLLDFQSIQYRLSKQSTYVKHFKYTFILLLLFILISTCFFRAHIYIYNSLLGPFHYNFDEFIQHIKNFENGQSWFKRIEYIQIELGENNIQNPNNKYDTIKRYSDPFTRRNHIATYKQVLKPNIYVKLPTRSQNNFHAKHSFHFSSYSIRTLQCIVKQLQLNSQTNLIEKSEYVKYINEEYGKNSTLFNMLVITKCGILIGYLYRPIYEKAFLRTSEYTFSMSDIAFDAARQYCSIYPLIIFSLILIWLFLKSLFYLLIYLLNIIRYKLFPKIGLISFPLCLSFNIIEELWLLNIEGESYEQLLKLDELIQTTQYKYNDKLFIIENDFQDLFIILFKTKFNEERSPFIICPVRDIRKIVQYEGICYGNDLSWIPWPSTMTEDENYSEWLHEQLIEISDVYKNQYEYRLKNEIEPSSNNHLRQRDIVRRETSYEKELKQFIREEQNFQRLKLERQNIYERVFQPTIPASSKFIAKFRMKLKTNRIDSNMEKQAFKCMICLSEFELNDSYEKWPCQSKIPHIFHHECMLNILRRKNTCPICRYPIETDQTSNNNNNTFSQFFTQIVF